ncbi:hypothetical protein ACODT5_28645 [Streptomyces sp. 5.8]|uniref:hypothetical protein n=1 Tax=Streptomyces sp. 5.8 TaxID=3406571 RepID=UPI003BB55EF5
MSKPGPLIARTTAGYGHITLALAHWAGGHTVSAEELHRRIVKARAEAHAEAVEEHAREARRAHRRAAKLRRIAAEDGGLVPAAQADLTLAENEGRRHEAALAALGDFEVRPVDPGQIRHMRHWTKFRRLLVLASPVAGVVAGTALIDGMVFVLAVSSSVTACCMWGDKPFEKTVRPVPAELLADTAFLVLEPSGDQPVIVDTGKWKLELRTYVEQAVAIAKQNNQNGIHCVELLHGLHHQGQFLGITSATFPSKLRDADIPTKVVSVGGDKQLGVTYDGVEKALGRMLHLPAHLVPDLTVYPTSNPSPVEDEAA